MLKLTFSLKSHRPEEYKLVRGYPEPKHQGLGKLGGEENYTLVSLRKVEERGGEASQRKESIAISFALTKTREHGRRTPKSAEWVLRRGRKRRII